MFTNGIKSYIKNRNWFYALKYSGFFRLYIYFFRPSQIRQHEKEVRLYKRFLNDCLLIFDIGAYDGHKTAAFLKLSKTVVACEPDPGNFQILKARFRRERNKVILIQTALSDREGQSPFFIHHSGSAFNTLNPDWKIILENDAGKRWKQAIRFLPDRELRVETQTLDMLIEKYGLPDFIKIDVEGYEKKVFQGLSKKVPCVSFECLLPEFKKDLLAILELLDTRDSHTRYNVIHEEELFFPEFVSLQIILSWMETTDLFSFDMVAKTGN